MLMHKLLGRKPAPAPVPAPTPALKAVELRLYRESAFGAVLDQALVVRATGREDLLERIGRALNISGINLVRVGDTEYRLNNWGQVYCTNMWGRGN